MAEEPEIPTPPPGEKVKPPRADIDLDALFPMPERKGGLGHIADKWRNAPGPVNGLLLALSLIGMILLTPSLLHFALEPVEEGAPLFNYLLLLKLILFLGCLGFFCASAGFCFAHWLGAFLADLIFGMHDGPPPDKKP